MYSLEHIIPQSIFKRDNTTIRKDMHNIMALGFNKMLAGSIDIAIRPDGRGFLWDGFRRALRRVSVGARG